MSKRKPSLPAHLKFRTFCGGVVTGTGDAKPGRPKKQATEAARSAEATAQSGNQQLPALQPADAVPMDAQPVQQPSGPADEDVQLVQQPPCSAEQQPTSSGCADQPISPQQVDDAPVIDLAMEEQGDAADCSDEEQPKKRNFKAADINRKFKHEWLQDHAAFMCFEPIFKDGVCTEVKCIPCSEVSGALVSVRKMKLENLYKHCGIVKPDSKSKRAAKVAVRQNENPHQCNVKLYEQQLVEQVRTETAQELRISPMSAVAPKEADQPGRRRTLPEPVSKDTQFYATVDSVANQLAVASSKLCEELEGRFPATELLKAQSIVYTQYWDKQPTDEDFQQKLSVIKQQYGHESDITGPAFSMLSLADLERQAAQFITLMRRKATDRAKDQPAQQNAESPTSVMWRLISHNSYFRTQLSAFMRLAEIVLVSVPGSVEEERTNSDLAWLKDDRRNRLDEKHLNVCLRIYSQEWFTVEDFPYEDAFVVWSEMCTRRGVNALQ